MVSVLFSEMMVEPNVPKTSTKTAIIRHSPRGDRDTLHASSAYNIPQIARRTNSSVVSGPTFDGCSSWRWIGSASTPSSLLNLSSATRSASQRRTHWTAAAGKVRILPYGAPVCATSNHSEHRPSSFRKHALIPSWNWRITSNICDGIPKRASNCQRNVRSTGCESYAFTYGKCETDNGSTVRAKNQEPNRNLKWNNFFFFKPSRNTNKPIKTSDYPKISPH